MAKITIITEKNNIRFFIGHNNDRRPVRRVGQNTLAPQTAMNTRIVSFQRLVSFSA
jgi:hypothetical protein